MFYSIQLVSRQISWDIAQLCKEKGVENLTLDDVILAASVPVILLDFRLLTPSEERLNHFKFVRMFLNLNEKQPRYQEYTQEAAKEALQTEWIPNIGAGFKAEILRDLKIVDSVDTEHDRVHLNEKLYNAYLNMHFESLKYGQLPYMPIKK